ncbi:MAG: hypothetical protein ACKVP5_06080 [Aestuariivirga sp.]
MFSSPGQAETAITLAFLILGLALAGLMAWIERRPRTNFKPRLVPTTPIMFLGVLVALIAAVHILNLYGIKTGR